MTIRLSETELGQELRRSAQADVFAALLRRRFGDDPRIPGIAERLADEPEAAAVEALESAGSLDDLA